jgi:hypothetical protein
LTWPSRLDWEDRGRKHRQIAINMLTGHEQQTPPRSGRRVLSDMEMESSPEKVQLVRLFTMKVMSQAFESTKTAMVLLGGYDMSLIRSSRE